NINGVIGMASVETKAIIANTNQISSSSKADKVIGILKAQINSLLTKIANLQKKISECQNPASLNNSKNAVSTAQQALSSTTSTAGGLQNQVTILLTQISALQAQLDVCKKNQSSITILSPNGGEVLRVGQTYDIKWTSQNLPTQFVNISLQRGNNVIKTLFTKISNDGFERWTIPADVVLASDYKINIDYNVPTELGSYQYVSDTSDSFFSIVASKTTTTLGATLGVQPPSSIAFRSQKDISFTVINLSASGGDIVISSLVIERTGLANDAAFAKVSVLDENNSILGTGSLNANHQSVIVSPMYIGDGQTKKITITADRSTVEGYAGQVAYFSLVGMNSNANITTGLPITGAGYTLSNVNIGEVGYLPEINQMANTLQATQDILEKIIELLKS
ncbi:MAG: hypothetical protein GXP44_00130, partial [bacterium]|nr:hypothetical protein [bacterium]